MWLTGWDALHVASIVGANAGSPGIVDTTIFCKLRGRSSIQMQSELTQPSLTPGVSHLWTTPIFRRQLGDHLDEKLLSLVERAVLRKFRAFSETFDPSSIFEEDETLNDRFFDMQRDRNENGLPWLLEQQPVEDEDKGHCGTGSAASSSEADSEADSEAAAFRTLRAAWLDCLFEYVSSASGVDVAKRMFAEESGIRLSVWASVHEGSR